MADAGEDSGHQQVWAADMRADNQPNIVIVVMDCVRAQNLSVYGYDRPTAPRIAELSTQGLRFDHAITAGDQTVASTASLFTGMSPSTHGLRVSGEKLDGQWHTLAEALQRAGYETHLLNCSNTHLSSYGGLDRGFDHYAQVTAPVRDLLGGLRQPPADDEDEVKAAVEPPKPLDGKPLGLAARWRAGMTDDLRWVLTRFADKGAARAFGEARRILRSHSPARPVFVYIHLMETHSRYLPPLGHWGLFLPDCRGRKGWRINHNGFPFLSGAVQMDALDFEIVEALYNGAIHYTDAAFGRFFKHLGHDGLLDNTVIVLTADHGDNFGEHGLFGHAQCVYDTVVRVPLLIWGPVIESHRRGSAITAVVQNTDLAASCLEWAGNEHDPINAQLEGPPLPLTPTHTRGRKYAVSEAAYLFHPSQADRLKELSFFDRGSIALRSKRHKLIWNTDGREEFYDLAADPGETDNQIARGSGELAELRRVLEPRRLRFDQTHSAMLMRLEQGAAVETDPLVEERLRDLGYIE